MTYRAWVAGGIATMAVLLAARAEAQPLIILPDHPTIGGSVAVAGNGDHNSDDASTDLAAAVDLPLLQPFRVRLTAGRVAWSFGGTHAERDGLPLDTVSLTRATVSLLKLANPLTPGVRLVGYLGGGVGIYHYRFRRGRGASPTRAGVHGIIGFDYTLPNHRAVLGWDAQLHDVRGPDESPVASYSLFVLQTSLSLKYRF